MEEKTKRILLTTDSGLSYEDYLDFCEDNGIEPAEEDSQAFYDWVSETESMYLDDEWEDLKNLLPDTPCLVTGTLGLWNGNPTIEPFITDNLSDAVNKCVSGSDAWDYELSYSDGDKCFNLECRHHDGTNCFSIYPLDSDGYYDAKDALEERGWGQFLGEREEFEPDDEWLRQIVWPNDFC